MATEPDDIVVDAGVPANDDPERTQEVVSGHRSDFEAVPSIAQAPRKTAGQCRMVVEFPFDFSLEYLAHEGVRIQGRKFHDGVEYLRLLAKDFAEGTIDLDDIRSMSVMYSDDGVRMTPAK